MRQAGAGGRVRDEGPRTGGCPERGGFRQLLDRREAEPLTKKPAPANRGGLVKIQKPAVTPGLTL